MIPALSGSEIPKKLLNKTFNDGWIGIGGLISALITSFQLFNGSGWIWLKQYIYVYIYIYLHTFSINSFQKNQKVLIVWKHVRYLFGMKYNIFLKFRS